MWLTYGACRARDVLSVIPHLSFYPQRLRTAEAEAASLRVTEAVLRAELATAQVRPSMQRSHTTPQTQLAGGFCSTHRDSDLALLGAPTCPPYLLRLPLPFNSH